jgi:LPXTG-motif cell wall-anchored protein
MKKSKKQELLSRLIVSSSIFILGSPIIMQATVNIPAVAETFSTPETEESTIATSEALLEQQEIIEEEKVPAEETNTTEPEVSKETTVADAEKMINYPISSIASENTPVKVHYVDLNGNSLASTVTIDGAPTGKANAFGDFSYEKAVVDPKNIQGYSLVNDHKTLPINQLHQLEATLSLMGEYVLNPNLIEDKIIFATKQLNVPYPGFADRFYDFAGNIVTDGSVPYGRGYGQTDVYYFYVPNQQKVVYNVIDDTDGNILEENITFEDGAAEANLNKKQADLQAIAEGYLPKGYEIVSVDSIPSFFDKDDMKDQVVNIHLKHRTDVKEETKEVKQTIYYVYEDGTEAAGDQNDKIIFTRDIITDLVTGLFTYSEWEAKDNDTTFDEVASPEIKNYIADKSIVDEVNGVTPEDSSTEITVTYKARMKTITETKEVKQTIHYVYEDGKEALPDKVDTVSFTRTVTTNEATGVTTYGKWQAKDDDTTFDAVKSVEIDGYKADLEIVKEQTGMTAENKDSEITVTYTKNTTYPSTDSSDSPTKSGVTKAPTTKVSVKQSAANKQSLPKTGEQINSYVLYSGVTLITATLLGIFVKRSRHNVK